MKSAQNVAIWRVLLHAAAAAAMLYICLFLSQARWLLRRGDDAGFIILAVLAMGAVIILEVLYKRIMYQHSKRQHWWRPLLFYSTLGMAAVVLYVVYPHFAWRMRPDIRLGLILPSIAVLMGLLPALRVMWLGLGHGWYRLR